MRERRPNLQIEGELQADVACRRSVSAPIRRTASRDPLTYCAFDLDAGNIGCKLICVLGTAGGGTEVIGPRGKPGTEKPVALLTPESGVEDIVQLTALAALRVGFALEFCLRADTPAST